jgi:L-2-hydroxyglutarate oxidase LhgO
MISNYDFVIIGGGVIGISVALSLRKKYSDATILVLEKEPEVGAHGSGRNSGVLHAGFYYTADSLKAKFTRLGNLRWKEFISEKNLSIRNCGKLVVARNESELKVFDELLERAKKNGVRLHRVSEAEALEIEPKVKTFREALFSPDTATANPLEVIQALKVQAEEQGIRFSLLSEVVRCSENVITYGNQQVEAGYVVNAAGLYADRIAKQFGFSENHTILPFKGLYLYSNRGVGEFRTNIYPVPDLRNPFLGVHVTVAVDGHGKVGPTAIPALWREQYGGTSNFKFKEFVNIAIEGMGLMVNADFDFRRLAYEEIRKYSRSQLVRLASSLAEGIDLSAYKSWGRPGIRAQLMDTRTNSLVMDFHHEADSKSFHILNAVSPGWTCAMPFADYMVDCIDDKIN